MTCIVGIAHEGTVIMGCDSAGVGGYSLQHRADPKIYRVGSMLIGFTTSFRMGQLLGYQLELPDHDPRHDVDRYMATVFVDAVRNCLKAGGFASKDKETEQGGTFLVGYRGQLFQIESDYQVGRQIQNYSAIGCGFDLALGSLYTTEFLQSPLDPEDRIQIALAAAAKFSAGVCGPFKVEKVRDAK